MVRQGDISGEALSHTVDDAVLCTYVYYPRTLWEGSGYGTFFVVGVVGRHSA